jgi:hypothetical protein
MKQITLPRAPGDEPTHAEKSGIFCRPYQRSDLPVTAKRPAALFGCCLKSSSGENKQMQNEYI